MPGFMQNVTLPSVWEFTWDEGLGLWTSPNAGSADLYTGPCESLSFSESGEFNGAAQCNGEFLDVAITWQGTTPRNAYSGSFTELGQSQSNSLVCGDDSGHLFGGGNGSI